MSGLESKRSRELYIGDLMQSLLLDLMDGDDNLLVTGPEVSTCADQMQNHFLSNVCSAGPNIVVAEQWRVFDKDDESHRPNDGDAVFLTNGHSIVSMTWRDSATYPSFTAWMPITIPSPPLSPETGSEKQ